MTRNGFELDVGLRRRRWRWRTAAPALAQQRHRATRVHELIAAGGRHVASAQTGARRPPSRRPGAPAAARRRRCALTLDDAVKLALDRNLDIAVQRLNPQINDIAVASIAVGLPPDADVDGRRPQSHDQPVDQHASRAAPAAAGGHRRRPNYNGGIAQNMPWGGGSSQRDAEQHQRSTTTSHEHAVQPDVSHRTGRRTYTQPLLRNFTIDSTRQQLRGHQAQPGHLRHPAAARRSPTRCRTCATRTGTTSSPSSRSTSRSSRSTSPSKLVQGQPDARRGRHDGADRRRPGAVAGGDARQNLVAAAGDAADGRARAEAADRRRHAGSELERRRSIRSIGPTSAPSRSTSRRRSGARSASAPTSTIAQEEHRRPTTSR